MALAPACYDDDSNNSDNSSSPDAGPLTRPDLDASGGSDRGETGGRPDVGGVGDASSDSTADGDETASPDSGTGPVTDLETAARLFATVGCEGLRECTPDRFSFYYSALGECVYERSTGLMDYIGYADDDCIAAMAEYVDCVDTNGECLIGDYYGYEIEYFGVDAGACDTAKSAFGAACGVDVSG